MNRLNRRDFVKKAALVSALGTLGRCSGSDASGKTPGSPNLIIVFPDQMRGQALGFMDEDPVVTPNLDRFSRQSLVLTRAVSNYPVCSPFRGMLMTGMYPHANGVMANCNSNSAPSGCELDASDRCWSDVLKDHDFSLGYIGKWHLDAPHEPYIDCKNNRGKKKWNEWCPPERRHGFHFWYAYGTYDDHLNPMYWRTDAARDEFHFVEQWGPEHEADVAIDYIFNRNGHYRKSGTPFALVVSMNPPHTPYDRFPRKYLNAYDGKSSKDLLIRPNVARDGKTKMSSLALTQTKNYFANITGIDEQFGRILQAVDDAGLRQDTIVLFMSDHGNCLGTHDQIAKNNPYEESMRIPFIIRWPDRIKVGQDDLLISVPDIYPTLLDLMGFRDSIPESVQGVSHAATFLGRHGRRPSSQLYLKIPHQRPSFGLRGVRTHRYKFIAAAEPDTPLKFMLYDLASDPYELTNIALQRVDIVQRLTREELCPWLQRTGDPWIIQVLPNNEYFFNR